MRAIIRASLVFRHSRHPNIHSTPYCYHGTIDQKEVNKFSELCDNWWNESGDLKALHTLNQLRVPLIRDGLAGSNVRETATPLSGLHILDVGCGGGILTEALALEEHHYPVHTTVGVDKDRVLKQIAAQSSQSRCLARLGASVTAVDASEENIEAAKWHATLDHKVQENTRYIAQPVEKVEGRECFDAVVASEIIEHVSDVNTFVKSCCDLIKPGGSLFVTTINRTWLSWALAVVAAEKVFRLVPDGSHDWNKFVSAEELSQVLHQNHMTTRLVHGMLLNPLTLRWQWTGNTSINYALHALKETSQIQTSDSDSSSDSE